MDYDIYFSEDFAKAAEYIQTNSTNATHRTPGAPGRSPPDSVVQMFDYVSVYIYGFITPVTIVSNILIFWGIVLYPGFYNSNNIFLLSLAVFDFLVGLIATPLILLSRLPDVNEYMTSRKQLCLLKMASSSFSIGGSLYSLLVISIDRYLAIMFPLKYKKWVTAERAYKVVFFIWFYIFFRASIPAMGLNKYDPKLPADKRCTLTTVYDPIYYNFVINWAGRIVFGISLFINIHIALVVRKQIKSFKSEKSVWTSEQIKSFDARISSVKITLVLTALFLFLWAPVFFIMPFRNYDMLSPRATAITRNIMGVCLTANSMVNAPIYAAIRNEYRDVYKTMLTTWPWHWRKELRALHRVRNTSHISSYKSEMSTAKSVESGPEEKFEEEIHEDKVSVVSKQETVVSDDRHGSTVDPRRDTWTAKQGTQDVLLDSVVRQERKSLEQQSQTGSGSKRSSGVDVRSVSTVQEKLDAH